MTRANGKLMRAAVVGTGLMAHTHARALTMNGVELALVVGHRSESAAAFAQQYDCPVSCTELTDQVLADVDAVHICTPPAQHFETAKQVLMAGKALFCEKPLTFSVREAEELCRIAEKSGAKAAVDFNNRFYPACGEIRDRIVGGSPVVLIHGHYRQEFQMMPAPWSWRYTDPMRAVSEIGSHFVDLMRFLSGLEVESVSAVFQTVSPQRRVKDGEMRAHGQGECVTVTNEDAAAVTMKLQGGAIASCFLSEISPGRSNDLAIELVTEQESLGWCSEEPYCVIRGGKSEGMTKYCNAFSGGFSTTVPDTVENFYHWIDSGIVDSRLATLTDGLAAVKICEAMKRSAEAGGAFVEI